MEALALQPEAEAERLRREAEESERQQREAEAERLRRETEARERQLPAAAEPLHREEEASEGLSCLGLLFFAFLLYFIFR